LERVTIRQALLTLQTHVTWAEGPDAAAEHLDTRLSTGALAPGADLDDYEAIIRSVADGRDTKVYVDEEDDRRGGAIALLGTADDGAMWFVKVTAEGEVWTGFPPYRLSAYVDDQRYQFVGDVRSDVMEERVKSRALALWRLFPKRTYRLDLEALDALLLRDELEAADLSIDEYAECVLVDVEVYANAERIANDLERSTAWGSIVRTRQADDKPRLAKWWWLDYVAGGKPIEPHPVRASATTATDVASAAPQPVQHIATIRAPVVLPPRSAMPAHACN
jgi:hypothetical protein